MRHTKHHDDDDESEWDEEDDAYDDDDESAVVPCPYCRREIHEDAERCPYCERYISAEDQPGTRQPWWIIGGVLVCLLIVLWWITKF